MGKEKTGTYSSTNKTNNVFAATYVSRPCLPRDERKGPALTEVARFASAAPRLCDIPPGLCFA